MPELTFRTALEATAMQILTTGYDTADFAGDLADEWPGAFDQLPTEAQLAGLGYAINGEYDEENDQASRTHKMRHLMDFGAICHELERMVEDARPAPATPSRSAPTPAAGAFHADLTDWAADQNPEHGARMAACLLMQACVPDGTDGTPNPDSIKAFAGEMGPDYAASFMTYAAAVFRATKAHA